VIIGCSRWGEGDVPGSLHDFAVLFNKIDEATSQEGTYQPVYDALRVVEEAFPESSTDSLIRKHKVPSLRHVRYDLMKILPDNFAVHGDAFITVNPIFGQGCTKAAMDATTLDAFLRTVPASRSFVPSGFSKRMIALQTNRDRFMYNNTRFLGKPNILPLAPAYL
jgi:2-polyprenyl-6-methoxyphenol hydroxylase-like FAD-dependent oxidoreductase